MLLVAYAASQDGKRIGAGNQAESRPITAPWVVAPIIDESLNRVSPSAAICCRISIVLGPESLAQDP